MPRAGLHHGRPTYPPLIDERWAVEHAEVADEQFTSEILIALPDVYGEYDESIHGRPKLADGQILYEGLGRIQSVGAGDESTVDLAGQQVTVTRYRVSYPREEWLAPVGTVVTISDESIRVHGREKIHVTVTGYGLNSIRFQTDMLAEANEG